MESPRTPKCAPSAARSLLLIPSPARAREPEAPEAAPEAAREAPEAPEWAKAAKASKLSAQAKEFVPSALAHVPTPLRVEGPVVSVKKMGSKGCALVLLRDEALVALAARMAVAIIDGVCVELRRHRRGLGVFVAWGHRVERKASVGEAALEEFFQGLARLSTPRSLERLEEELSKMEPVKSEIFPLSSCVRFQALGSKALKVEDSCEALLMGPHGRPEMVRNLWDAKASLDELWKKPPPPLARSVMQRVARDQLFEEKEGKDGKDGSKEHENRAGEKLQDLAEAVGLLDISGGFLDLCGGPGAWSLYLLQLKRHGFGFTLRSGAGEEWQAEDKDDWYPELLQHPHWRPLWGADGTGDLLNSENLQHAAKAIHSAGGVSMVVADGGFSDKAIPANLLELYFYRLFMSEILMACSCLLPGGRFVCKLYSSFSNASSSLLYLSTRLFEEVQIIKPRSSRAAGPERYLCAKGFKANAEAEVIRWALWLSHRQGHGSPLQLHLAPLLDVRCLTDRKLKTFDENFTGQLQAMVERLCLRQCAALRQIRSRADALEEMAVEVAQATRKREAREAREARETRLPKIA